MALYIIDMILEHQHATMCDVFEVDTSSSIAGHTSKPGPDSDSDLDSDPKKIRTREKPGLVLGLAFKKPGLDNRKPGLQIKNTGFDETGF